MIIHSALNFNFCALSPLSALKAGQQCSSCSFHNFALPRPLKRLTCFATSIKSEEEHFSDPKQNAGSRRRKAKRPQESKVTHNEDKDSAKIFPITLPKKPRRGRRGEAAAVEDFVRDSLEKTFASIREQNSEIIKDTENILKDRVDDDTDSDESSDDEDESSGGMKEKKMIVEEEDPDWPLDADVGWGIRASEYFDKHPIKNVIGEDGVEIDWEGEIDDCWVKEINCLEWESFAFHPSNCKSLMFSEIISSLHRASDNWKALKELEKAAKVYWSAKERLPPRTVKIDINIERDLAFALKVKECPQILFLRGNRILYREKDIRMADDLVRMIAYFYYNAKKPSCINDEALSPRS
ncbi:ATP citrate lyase (ACL) family protein [Capsicum annuum]|nr:ATP citrate lyase (ACL) family protein [Capsicum annuum]